MLQSHACHHSLLVLQRSNWHKYAGSAARFAAQTAKHGAADSAGAASEVPSVEVAGAQPDHFWGSMPPFNSNCYKNLVPESCTPQRPSYAVDLRDQALTAANYPTSRMLAYDVNFNPVDNPKGQGIACAVNGALWTFPNYQDPLVMQMGEVVQWTTNNVSAEHLGTQHTARV